MAMNNKNTPSGKSLKMSADDLKEMVKAAVAECLSFSISALISESFSI